MRAYRVLGGVQVLEDGEDLSVGGPRQRRLLAMLLVHRNEPVSSDRLVEAVFAGEPTPAAATTLRSYVARLRRVLHDRDEALATQPPGYVLEVPDDAIDAGVFESLLADGRARRTAGDPIGAATSLRQALEAWGGPPYPEFAEEDWVRPEVQRLERLRLAAEEHLLDAELACGLDAELVARLEHLVAQDPLAETFRVKLAVALYRSGRQVDALEVVQEYRELLAEELGLDPSPDLVELERRVLVHDETLRRPAPPGRVVRGYHLGERLGTGRDGTVHAARLAGVERDLVIRIVPPEIADRPDVVRSFDATMRRVAALHDEAIVPIHDHWREAGAAYVVMRRMVGGSLAARLEQGLLDPTEAAALARRIGAALAAAHEQGVVHGRVIAESVLLDAAGRPFLSDFPVGSVAATEEDDAAALIALVVRGLAPGADRNGGTDTIRTRLLADLEALTDAPPGAPAVVTMAALVDRLGGGSQLAASAGVTRRANPYKGLRAFDESDAADFFGRDDLVDDLVGRLGDDGVAGRFVLLVGASGCGKSSVVRAGLLPRVRAGAIPGSRDWLVTTMVPGPRPFKELAQGLEQVATSSDRAASEPPGPDLADDLVRAGIDGTLRRILPADAQLLLVVDQFEELFTLAAVDEQRRFLNGLVDAIGSAGSRLRVVATLRADFYDRPLRFNALGNLVRDATVPVPAMQSADLEAAIVGPARRVGLDVEAALVAELVASVIDEPAAMPSLQFTLYQLADRADTEGLTLRGIRAIGGLGGAIAARAEDLYRSLDDDRVAVRDLFEHLVVLGVEGEPTRRRTPRSELAAALGGRPADEVVEPWAQARLLTHDRDPVTREPTVEVAHEALLREWPRLHDWIEESRAAIAAAGQVRAAADEWEALDRDPGALYRGSRLDQATSRLAGREATLPDRAREFLAASRAARDEEHHRRTERMERQARTNRRLRVQLGALALALFVALAGGWLALDQRQQARGEQRAAVARELAAAAVATLDEDPELSMLLALEAVDRTRAVDGTVVPEAHGALHQAVTSSRIALSVPGLGGPVDWSADGSVFITEGPEESGVVDIRDAETGDSVLAFTGHDVDINDVAFSADGALLATAGDDGAAKVWDVETGEEVASFTHDGVVLGLSFDGDGSMLAASWRDEGLVRVHDLDRHELVSEVELDGSSTSFSPDDDRLVVAAGRRAVVVDVATGAQVREVVQPNEPPNPLGYTPIWATTWSPDGRWIATGGTDGRIRVWDAETGDLHAVLSGHDGTIIDLDWAEDSARLASGSEDGSARVWEVAEAGGVELARVAARDTMGVVAGVAFSPGGDRLLTGDGGIRAAKIWDLSHTGGAEHLNLPGSPNSLGAVDIGPDGQRLVATGDGVAGIVWDLTTGERIATLGEQQPGALDRESWEIDVSPDGALVATAAFDGPVRVWEVETGDLVFTAEESVFRPGAAWSSDGRLLATTSSTPDDGWTTIYDRAGNVVQRIDEEPGFAPINVHFDPANERLATTRREIGRLVMDVEGLIVRDIASGAILQRMRVVTASAEFDPTGDRIVADELGAATVWDPATGEPMVRLTGHTGQVTDATFHPDGHTVATASVDGTIRLWSVESGAPTLVLHGHEGPAGDVSFSRDGALLASSGEGEIRVWALDLDDLIEIARSRLTRDLSDVECRQFLHVTTCP